MTAKAGVTFIDSYDVTDAESDAYLVPANLQRVTFTSFIITNYHASDSATLDVWIVESGGSTSGLKKIINTRVIAANAKAVLPVEMLTSLDQGDRVVVQASANTSISITRASGITYDTNE